MKRFIAIINSILGLTKPNMFEELFGNYIELVRINTTTNTLTVDKQGNLYLVRADEVWGRVPLATDIHFIRNLGNDHYAYIDVATYDIYVVDKNSYVTNASTIQELNKTTNIVNLNKVKEVSDIQVYLRYLATL